MGSLTCGEDLRIVWSIQALLPGFIECSTKLIDECRGCSRDPSGSLVGAIEYLGVSSDGVHESSRSKLQIDVVVQTYRGVVEWLR